MLHAAEVVVKRRHVSFAINEQPGLPELVRNAAWDGGSANADPRNAEPECPSGQEKGPDDCSLGP